VSEQPHTVFWHYDGPTPAPHRLDGPLEVDVLIIGGGFTGLSTAIHLKEREPGLSVAVCEAQHVGWGASGRNTGFLTPLIGHDLHALLNKLGATQARTVASFGLDAVRTVESLIQRHDIECHYENTGLANPGFARSHLAMADKLAHAADVLGVDHERWDRDEVRERLGVARFEGAYYQPHGGILHPYRLARGLADAARRLGVQIWEDAPVSHLELGRPVRAMVREHPVSAAHLVIATNAYTEQRHLRWTYAPLHVYSIVTEPLTDAQLSSLGWPGREGFYTLHHILYALRLTHDNRLVAATGNVRYFWNNQRHIAAQPADYARLERAITWCWPQLTGVRTAFRWEGVLAVTLSDLPYLGRHNQHHNVLHGIAYCGHGVSLANHSGKALADLLCGDVEPWVGLPFVERAPFPPAPGEPLRKPVAGAYIGVLRALDWWANRGSGL